MKGKETNMAEELKEIDLDSVSGGESYASLSVDKNDGRMKIGIKSDSVDTAVNILDEFIRHSHV